MNVEYCDNNVCETDPDGNPPVMEQISPTVSECPECGNRIEEWDGPYD